MRVITPDALLELVNALAGPGHALADSGVPLSEAGLDSLAVLELVVALEDLLEVQLPLDPEGALVHHSCDQLVDVLVRVATDQDLGVLARPGTERVGSQGVYSALRPFLPGDAAFLYRLLVDQRVGPHWRFGGRLPPPEVLYNEVQRDAHAVCVASSNALEELIGCVSLYNVDELAGIGHLAAVYRPDRHRLPEVAESVALFISQAFYTFALRKIYVEVPDFNRAQFASMLRDDLFDVEVRFERHWYLDGRWWDVSYAALDAHTWRRRGGVFAWRPERR